MADPLQPLLDLGCEVVVKLTWTRACPRCGSKWTNDVEAATLDEAVKASLEIEADNDADPDQASRCLQAQEDGRRG